jgi:hypothetical protein
MKALIDRASALGRRVDDRWRRAGRLWPRFADIAEEEVRRAALHDGFSDVEVWSWLARQVRLPVQHDPEARFGQPPVTVWRSEHCFVDVYFWVTPEVAIHDHGFTGAFTNLQGRSFHARYAFAERERPAKGVMVGELRLEGVEHLVPGSVQPIAGGRGRYIHQVWHLDRPTITLVVRTPRFGRGAFHQYGYYKPELASRQLASPLHTRRLQAIELLYRIDHPEKERLAQDLVLAADSWSVFHMLKEYFFARRTKYFEDTSAFDALVGRVAARHGSWATCYGAAVRSEDLYRMVRWERIVDAKHRLLPALLLTLGDRASIDEAIRAAYPTEDPADFLLDCVAGVTQVGGWSLAFNETQLEVIGLLLRGLPPATVRAELARTHELDDDDADKLDRLCEQLPRIQLFKPLFQFAAGGRPADAALQQSSRGARTA